MFDVFLALFLLRALFVTARGRHAPALTASIAALALFTLLATSGWYARRADALGSKGAWLLVGFGPSSFPDRTDAVPLSGLVGAYPNTARLLFAAILFGGFAAAWRYADRVSPLSDEYVRRKDMGLALLAPALLVAFQLGVFAMAERLTAPF